MHGPRETSSPWSSLLVGGAGRCARVSVCFILPPGAGGCREDGNRGGVGVKCEGLSGQLVSNTAADIWPGFVGGWVRGIGAFEGEEGCCSDSNLVWWFLGLLRARIVKRCASDLREGI